LKNYLRCCCGVKNRLKMLIYYAKTSLFRLFLPCIDCLENVFQRIWTPPVLQTKFVMILRCNCFRISGFSLDSFAIRAMMDFARKIQIGLAALPYHVSGREPVEKTELLTPV
jgi:hypothetical protein